MAIVTMESEVEDAASRESAARDPAANAEALRHRSLAEHHYLRSDLKSALSHARKALRLSPALPGLPQLVAALRVLNAPPLDPLRILSLPPSSPLSSARRRVRSLSLLIRSPPSPSCSADALLRLRSAIHLLSRTPTEPTLAQLQLQALKRKRLPKEEPRDISPQTDFHDFDADRTPNRFRKGQVWAVHAAADGMTRRYVLIDEVASACPFQLRITWLEPQETCGRFKVGKKMEVLSASRFSHLVICQREAREVYGIYPRKGSLWAVKGKGKGQYEVVVVLMGYSEAYGMSIAYLEKVDGFRAVFRRKEVGLHAVTWLGREGLGSFSHQVPASRLTGEEGSGVPGDCWEIDPRSLPASLLRRR